MTLTMRPTGLSSPSAAHLQDWEICEDGKSVGRIYERVATRPEYRWLWSMTLMVDWRVGIVTSGNVDSLEEAKARWRQSYDRATHVEA